MSTLSITLTRMGNEVHTQFHESVLTAVEQATPQALAIEALHTLYRRAFDEQAAALLIITRSETTALISQQDAVRDSIFRGFSDTVKGLRNHFDSRTREHANRLWNVFLHYGNIARKTLDAQTAATNDILREFERPDIAEAISALNVADWRDRLDEENRKFHQLMMQRYSEQAALTTVRMRTARTETDRFYRAVTNQIDNQVLTGANDSAAAFVNELNAIIRRYKSILAQQFARK